MMRITARSLKLAEDVGIPAWRPDRLHLLQTSSSDIGHPINGKNVFSIFHLKKKRNREKKIKTHHHIDARISDEFEQ